MSLLRRCVWSRRPCLSWIALLLGIVEGLTEYLPVSSTGHLVLVSQWLGEKGDAAAAFDIVIQLGAILAVLVEYRGSSGSVRGGPPARSDERALPRRAGRGVRAHGDRRRAAPQVDQGAPLRSGADRGGAPRGRRADDRRRARARRERRKGEDGLDKVTWRRALAIGLGQVVSMWPGSSRSMCTIVAGQLTGLSTATAAEFSFLLGLPTLGAATIYEAWKSRKELGSGEVGGAALAIGLVVSFLVAWAVIRGFVQYLKKRGLEPFGVYRVILGAIVLWITLR